MLHKIREHRFLFEELVKRDFKKKYKRSVLGVAWSLLNPLLSLLIMRLVFSRLFGASIEHYTTYIFCGNIIFSIFTESTTEGMTALLYNASIFSKVNVPKYLFIVSKNVQTLLNFGITLLVFFLMCIFDGIRFTGKFFLLLYPILMLFLFNLGVALILSALFIFFRDMQYLWGVVVQLTMYLSAVFYSVTAFPENVQKLFLLNPLYVFISYFRSIVIDSVIPGSGIHLLIALYAFLAIALGLLVYRKYDDEFLYYI